LYYNKQAQPNIKQSNKITTRQKKDGVIQMVKSIFGYNPEVKLLNIFYENQNYRYISKMDNR